ncbi:DUF2202 domain-containing protein [Pontiella sulfatireligans]|uniref:DUF2202 domain-containing protein n=1 Tax=Pontiella sulfatireligans TaxID=2750658 RepID=A0A6C2UTJ5_9BACT|nr:DUF2202 domain-containing protein [Pontiella sulfatireligans]VGO22611.1 hypothetical protein SCARR_04696 [Pontiella sulfatireligans]
MNRRTLLALVVGCMIAGWMLQPVIAGKGGGGGSVPVLTDEEAADLLFMREEEKLARDVYITFYDKWHNQVFDNISQSEQKHTDAVLDLILKYGLDDPALPEVGEFANAYLQDLYDELIAIGMASQLDALYVGALIEEVDIEDIVLSMERTDKADILNVYGDLLAGSESHLNAFVKNIEAIIDGTYEAQYITQEEVDAILGR